VHSNFLDVYNKTNLACDDIFCNDSRECTTIKAALQAVEIDQQPANSKYSPVCQGKTPKKPGCASVERPTLSPTNKPSVEPTAVPIPTDGPLPTGGNHVKEMKYSLACVAANTTNDVNTKFKMGSYTCFDGSTGSVGDGVTCYTANELDRMAMNMCSSVGLPTGVPPEPTSVPTLTQIPTELSPTSEVTGTPYQTPYPTEGPNPTQRQSSMKLLISLRFQGIVVKPNEPYNTMMVRIGLVSKDGGEPSFANVAFSSTENAVWKGVAQFDAPEGDYYVLVKGPMHMQSKVCHNAPFESYEGTYRCGRKWIHLNDGDNTLDFSGIYQMSGDLPSQTDGQDGISNSFDVYVVRYNIGSRDTSVLPYCDINRDGACNTQDYSLLLSSYAIKLDDE